MGKSFKLRLYRMIPSFHCCRSKDTATLPENPVPSFRPLSPEINGSLRRHASSAIATVGCGCRSSKSTRLSISGDENGVDDALSVVKCHVVRKCRRIYNTSVSGTEDDEMLPPPPPPPPPTVEKRRRRKKKRRSKRQRRKAAARMLRLSTSSADSGFYFSSEGGSTDQNKFNEKGGGGGEQDEGETQTLVYSSRSFCTDSSSDYSKKKKKKNKEEEVVVEEEARLSVFKRLMPCGVVEGKVRESFAVVKRSDDPYEDFKRSMLEMILEKNMFEREELEHLLHCFLSLNARHHHGVIVGAFSEIWETLFCRAI